MSYSRWLNSKFYTFWSAGSGETKDEQVFEICPIKSFTYKELKEDIDACIARLKEDIDLQNEEKKIDPDKHLFGGGNYDETDYEELKVYMKRFIIDVESDYKENE